MFKADEVLRANGGGEEWQQPDVSFKGSKGGKHIEKFVNRKPGKVWRVSILRKSRPGGEGKDQGAMNEFSRRPRGRRREGEQEKKNGMSIPQQPRSKRKEGWEASNKIWGEKFHDCHAWPQKKQGKKRKWKKGNYVEGGGICDEGGDGSGVTSPLKRPGEGPAAKKQRGKVGVREKQRLTGGKGLNRS